MALHDQINRAAGGRMTSRHLGLLWDAAVRAMLQGKKVELSPDELLALVGEVEEHRQAK